MPETKSTPAEPRRSVPVFVYIFAGLFVVGGLLFWRLNQWAPPAPTAPVLTAEAKAYVKHLRLSEVDMQAHESYLKQRVVQILGKIANNGGRSLQLVEINCVFYDPYGQVVLRERVPIAGGRMGSLKPGETRSFRLPFDNLPESWNQTLPQLVIARILFD